MLEERLPRSNLPPMEIEEPQAGRVTCIRVLKCHIINERDSPADSM